MTDGFLPAKYERPSRGGFYMKFEDGDNRFRALSSAVIGWEKWGDDKKVMRFKIDEDHPENSKHFWAFPVWNYQEEKIQILILTQVSIMESLEQLVADEDYGSPVNYDIVVTKVGEGMKTKYQSMPKLPKPLSKEIQAEFSKYDINLNALFEAGDAFPINEKKESLKEDVDPDTVPDF